MLWDPGLNQGNLAVVGALIVALLFMSTRAKVLDKSGLVAAVVLAAVVGGLGHWTWLLLLLSFLASSHYATKHRFEEKAAKGMSESGDGSRVGPTWSPTVGCRVWSFWWPLPSMRTLPVSGSSPLLWPWRPPTRGPLSSAAWTTVCA